MEGKKNSDQKQKNSISAFRAGTVCLVFLVIGYESALFTRRAAALAVQLRRDNPDTVYVVDESLARRLLGTGGPASASIGTEDGSANLEGSGTAGNTGGSGSIGAYRNSGGSGGAASLGDYRNSISSSYASSGGQVIIRRNAEHGGEVQKARAENRKVESFRFNPNTVSVEDLIRLGFTPKQAESIDNYREKGGVFRRKSDFARSYVVSDSVFRRLEPFMDIPRLDINKADSAAFDALPGVGPYFAAKMVQTRAELGGYSCKEQLLHIWNFDQQKYEGLKDLIVCSKPSQPFALWTLPADKIREHPYIRNWQVAKAIVFYREHNPKELWTVGNLREAGVIDEEMAGRLSLCLIQDPLQKP